MVEKPQGTDTKPVDTAAATATATAPPPPRRPGHRGADVRDTVAEMAARAQEISLEAGSKIAAAMKDVIGAAAGLTGFAVESARDLVQYMVRRGQMTQDEADKLIREVEDSQGTRRPAAAPRTQPRVEPGRAETTRLEPDGKRQPLPPAVETPPPKPAAKPGKPAARVASPARTAKKATARSSARPKYAAAKKKPAKAAKKKR
ncbi:MAG: hypothetical protein ACT4PJ_17680 [Gemmatimonadaceae bacterium]